MSRLRVKAILDNVPHLLEVDRKSVTFASLNSEIETKLKVGNAYSLIYQAPTGIQYQVLDDASLQRAIAESTKAGARSLDLKVLRSVTSTPNVSTVTPTSLSGSASTPTPQSQQPPPTAPQSMSPRSPAQSPAVSSVTPSAAPASSGTVQYQSQPRTTPTPTPTTTPTKSTPTWRSNQRPPEQPLGPNDILVTEFFLPRNPSTNLDKVKIVPDQTYSYFLFTPEASRYDTHVRVVLVDKVKLQYQCTYELDKDPSTRQFMLFTQSFQLPFDIDPKTVEVNGNQIKVMIPNRF
jgi:hypothetical protein